MIPHLVALLVLGLMCGSELNVALFSHPVLGRQPLETHVLVRSSLAALFGRVCRFGLSVIVVSELRCTSLILRFPPPAPCSSGCNSLDERLTLRSGSVSIAD